MRPHRKRIWLNCFLVAVLIFTLSPILVVFVNSFNSSEFSQWPPKGFTLAWYREVFDYPPFVSGFVTSLEVALLTTVAATILGTVAAYVLVRSKPRGAGLIASAFFLPLTIPRVAIGFALFAWFISWHTGLYGTITGVALGHVIIVFPFVVSIASANLKGVNPVYEEVARDLGAGSLTTFLKVTLPQMRTGIIISGLFCFIVSFDELELSVFLVRPDTNTLPVTMFLYLEQSQSPALAALSTLLVFMMVVAVLLCLPFMVRGAWRRSVRGISAPGGS